MASRKEYEMLFALNARMNSGFSGTFTKAQAEFSRLGKEIQELHQLQGDIASFQKQQAAIENTRSKLENLQKQHDLLQKEISETEGSTAALEREKVKLEQRIKDTETALERQNQKLQTTGNRLKEAGIDTANLAQKDTELTAKIKELQAEQDRAADSAASFGERSARAFDAIAESAINSKIVGLLGEIKDAFMDCVEGAASFEEAMSTVEALSQASAQDMAALAAEAKELGATTKFTAKESADAMSYMAMAGWNATDMLQGMDGVLQLAAASGENLALVSDIVTDSLSAFGLTARDTAHFSDVLAAAATSSNTNVAIMGDTFKMSASVAGALGYSIEDVAVAIGLMANNGVKGSIAGTALRNTFNGLLEGVTLTGDAFGEYEYSAVRADGTMKDFSSTIDELRGYFEQMTAAERVNNAMTIAGERGYNGLLAVLNATNEDYTSLANNINNCTGAAQRMAAVKLDNMNGQLTLMKSAWDGLKTTIGEQFIPEMRTLYEIGTDIFGGVGRFIQENPGVVKGIAAAAAVIGTVTLALTAYSAGAKIAAAASALLSASIPGVNIIMGVTAAVAGVVGVVTALATAADAGVPSVKELTEAAREMQTVMDEASTTYQETASQTLVAAEAAGTYIDRLKALESAEGANAAQSQEYQNTLALLLRTIPELSDSISQTTDEYGRTTYVLETSTAALLENAAAWKKNAEAQAYQEYLNSLMGQYSSVMLEAAENSIKLTQAQTRLETAEENLAAAGERMREIEEIGIGNDQELLQEYWQLDNAVQGYLSEVITAQQEIDTLNEAIERDGQAVSAAEAEIESAERAMRDLTGAADDYADGQERMARIQREAQEALSGTMEKVQALTQAYTEAYDEAAKSFSGQFGLFDEAQADAEATVGAAQRALDSQLSYWRGYAGNIETLRALSAEDLGVTQENYEALMSYVRSGTPEAAGLAASMVEQVNRGNTQALTDLANTLGEISASQDQAAQDVADWTSGLTEQMDQLLLDVAADVAGLDMGQEAALAAQNTIQSYIDQAGNMLPEVRNAYRELVLAAQLALTTGGAGQGNSWTSAVNPAANVAYYAGGTENAPPGYAWVGEDGPELMRMRGGEQVLPSGVSRRVAEEYSAYSRYTAAQSVQQTRPALEIAAGGQTSSGTRLELHFHIEAGASPETVNAWQDYANRGALKETILEVLEDAEEDIRRRSLT